MPSNYAVCIGSTLLDTTSRCSDCDVSLTDRVDFEPVMRLDTKTGEVSHHDICYRCIADIETVKEENYKRLISKLAQRYRKHEATKRNRAIELNYQLQECEQCI